jgi:hypothetical protein
MTSVDETIRSILEALREYMYSHYPERRRINPIPLEFWTIDDDDLFSEILGYLPLHMGVTDSGEVPNLDNMPEGFQLAFPVYWLEDDYLFNGWTALTNAGTWLLPRAILAYRRIGLPSEANALEAALRSCERNPHDTDAAEAAYKAVGSPFSDDDIRTEALYEFFRINRHLFAF